MTNDFTLLPDGAAAFPEIISCIRGAEKSIEITMFIWRGDEIGRTLAQEILAAADRGVRVKITKDRYGAIFEYCEESQQTLFHPTLSLYEWATVRVMELLYNRDILGKERPGTADPLLRRMKEHPNVELDLDVKRFDHSKYYIFDDRTLILGGINVEDKENGADRAGRRYRDYMIRLDGERYVRALREETAGGRSELSDLFALNVKRPRRVFRAEACYLRLIGEAERELTIVMAYFSPFASVMKAIRAAALRGVKIRILIPARANFQNDLNRRTMRALFRFAKKSGTDLRIFLSPDMVHTKLLMSEKRVSMGSCNITKYAFGKLDELNLETDIDASPFCEAVKASVEERFRAAAEVKSEADLSFSPGKALVEGLFM